MDFTVLIVGLFIGVGIPLRNKVIKEYRKKKKQKQQSSGTNGRKCRKIIIINAAISC